MTERTLRVIALLIAAAGVLDPSLTLTRRVPPVVELHVAAGEEDLAAAVIARLGARFRVVPAPVAGAAARLVVGGRLPRAAEVPAFVVVDDKAPLIIAAVEAPARAPLHGRVPVRVTLRSAGAAPPDAMLELRVGGLVADSAALADLPRAPDGTIGTTLSFTPAAARPHHLRVVAGETRADTLVSVDAAPWRVLSHDARPSWSATFVRRALEGDPRFALAARVDTAPRSAVASGAPPRLADAGALAAFDAVIVGAPDALDNADVAALNDFMRLRGGSVIVLMDSAPGAVARLAGVAAWDERLIPAPVLLRAGGAGAPALDRGLRAAGGAAAAAADLGLRASELALPVALPVGARLLAGAPGPAPGNDDAAPGNVPAGGDQPVSASAGGDLVDAVIWERPLGRGRLVVSGALDAWRYRAAAGARFDAFWRGVVAEAAAAAPAPVSVGVTPVVARPRAMVRVEVTLRDLLLAGAGEATARVSTRLEGGVAPVPVRLWPEEPGRLRGRLRLPDAPGAYRLVVDTDAGSAAVDLLVLTDAVPPGAAAAPLLEAWAGANGGELVPASRLGDLPGVLDDAIAPQTFEMAVHPLRSGWWIVPFALVLGAEWWLRRRRGAR